MAELLYHDNFIRSKWEILQSKQQNSFTQGISSSFIDRFDRAFKLCSRKLRRACITFNSGQLLDLKLLDFKFET